MTNSNMYPVSYSTNNNKGTLLALIFAGIFIAFFTGVFAAFGSPFLLMIFLGAFIGLGLIFKPRLAVWVVIIAGTIISGLVELYFPSLQQLRWGIALLSIVLILVSLVVSMTTSRVAKQVKLDSAARGVLFVAASLVVCIMFTVMANPSSLGTSLVGLKNYFQMFGLLAALSAFRYSPDEATRFMRFIILLGVIQLPFVLHQFIVLVPLRSSVAAAANGIVAVDVVAGTFGSYMKGGGRSAVLALLASIGIVLVLAQWRARTRSILSTFVYFLVFAFPMALNEAKLFIFLLPVGIFLLFKDRILKNPIKAIATLILVMSLIVGLFASYTLLPAAKGQHATSMTKYLDITLAYNVGKAGYGSGALNRTTVYPFWWKENIDRGDYLKAIIGHGLGASNSTSSVATNTLASTRYRGYGIGLTTVSSLLWEVGLAGTFVIFLFIFMAYRLGGKLEKRWRGSVYWPYIRTAQITMPLVAISLFHNNFFIFDIGYQGLFLLSIGYLVAMSRYFPEQY